MKRLVDVRSYKLKPGSAAAFHHAVSTLSVPMLRAWGTDVVAFGPSPHEADTYFLLRAYADLDDLNRRQQAFYGSDAWRQGPREAIVAHIESSLNTVLWLSEPGLSALRALNAAPA